MLKERGTRRQMEEGGRRVCWKMGRRRERKRSSSVNGP
jgi:hypothetical protein